MANTYQDINNAFEEMSDIDGHVIKRKEAVKHIEPALMELVANTAKSVEKFSEKILALDIPPKEFAANMDYMYMEVFNAVAFGAISASLKSMQDMAEVKNENYQHVVHNFLNMYTKEYVPDAITMVRKILPSLFKADDRFIETMSLNVDSGILKEAVNIKARTEQDPKFQEFIKDMLETNKVTKH